MAVHTHISRGDADRAIKGRLKVSSALTGVIFAAELIGGLFTNSLALMSDAAHVFMDVFALGLSLLAIYISELPPTERRTFGLHRVEVFVSFVNSFSLFLVTIYIFYRAWGRIISPPPVGSVGVMVVATVGLLVNLAVALWLKGFAKTDLNIRSAFLHVIGDAAASVGVIVGSVIIYFTGWFLVDPIISIVIGCIILFGVFGIMWDSSHILLEGVPKDIDLNRVLSEITSVKGVSSVHSLHVWSICHNVYALSAHVDVAPAQRPRLGEILNEINEKLAERYHIFYTTLQAECLGCNQLDVFRRLAHREKEHLH